MVYIKFVTSGKGTGRHYGSLVFLMGMNGIVPVITIEKKYTRDLGNWKIENL